MALMRNHFAAASECTVAADGVSARAAALSACILTPCWFLVQAPDEVDDVSHILLAQPVVDPCRHGGALHAVQDGIEQAPVAQGGYKEAVAEISRTGHDIQRIRPFSVGLAPVAAGAALYEDLLPVGDRTGARSHRVGFRYAVRRLLAARLPGEGGEHVAQHRFGPLGRKDLAPGGHRGAG